MAAKPLKAKRKQRKSINRFGAPKPLTLSVLLPALEKAKIEILSAHFMKPMSWVMAEMIKDDLLRPATMQHLNQGLREFLNSPNKNLAEAVNIVMEAEQSTVPQKQVATAKVTAAIASMAPEEGLVNVPIPLGSVDNIRPTTPEEDRADEARRRGEMGFALPGDPK